MFLKQSISLVLIAIIIIGCGAPRKVSETRTLMDTYVTITVFHSDRETAKAAENKAFSEMESLESIFNEFDPSSEVALLNSRGRLDHPSNDLVRLLEIAGEYRSLSSGAFDISVKPVLDLYRVTFGQHNRPPTEAELTEAMKLVHAEIGIHPDSISLSPVGAGITLGGIAKGYAIDKAICRLREEGIRHAMVNAGGDIRTIGGKPNGEPWIIALQNPRDKSDYITILGIFDGSVATSGDYERYFDPSKKAHHIIDPRTGRSAKPLISATIIAPDATQTDALATTVFVLGPKDGISLVERLDGVEALLITEERKIFKSSGFNRYELAD